LAHGESNKVKPTGLAPGAERLATATTAIPGPRADSDEDLVQRVLAGNSDAFDELVGRYQDRVFNTLARMCGSPQEAEDLAQETFLKAFRALGSFRQGSKFYTWLFRIAVNTGFSRRRQEVRRKVHEGGRLDAGGSGDSDELSLEAVIPDRKDTDPAKILERETLRARVREGLQEIDPDYRSILVLRDIEGMDYESIAESLDITTAAVKSRLHRARLELARILKDLRK
jgi:RNA polymerase sigma-70 factor (ECF subfamily)